MSDWRGKQNLDFFRKGLLHGADYNPDQWLDRPDILEEDIRLMKLAKATCMSVGIFAWATLEPEEGVYRMEWLRGIVDKLYENGIYTFLATPTGARPAWMAHKYPEVLRVADNGVRNLMGGRHNHCYSSPVYREKMRLMNTKLAEEFAGHPGVVLWHLSNEYSGTCYCPICQENYRGWLQDRYGSLEALNKAWWNTFWSHTYTDWSQVEPPMRNGERNVHGLNLDWRRFTNHMTIDFIKAETAALRAAGSALPTTANLMSFCYDVDYFKFGDAIDIVSWDSYPAWHGQKKDNEEIAVSAALAHDLMRGVKREPFLLMESTPSVVNWQPVNMLKRPGMHMLSSLQAVAHGANSVQYFQWRKSRGSSEKFHGAVVDHYGKEDTRVFGDVKELGERLEKLSFLADTEIKPEVCLLFDWENRWALDDAWAGRRNAMNYVETLRSHYRAFWERGIPVDIQDMDSDLAGYKLIVAPMLYLYRGGIQDKLRRFVEQGGTLVGTYWSGQVDESDLCFLGGTPGGGMMDVYGLRSEEIDALEDGRENFMQWEGKRYALKELCELVKPSSARILSLYGEDFYAGMPALTCNEFGAGKAYYLCARAEDSFYSDFYGQLANDLMLERALDADLPFGVTAGLRLGVTERYRIVQNYNNAPVAFGLNTPLTDAETEEKVDKLELPAYGVRILKD